ADGTMWGGGDNTYGDLGDGTTFTRNSPVQVSGLSGVTAIAAGLWHSLAVKSDGTVWAWGDNLYGEVGNSSTYNPFHTPVQVSGVSGMTAVAAGRFHSLALKSDGTVWAWGADQYGQLGYDSGTFANPTPVQVSGLSSVTAIAGAEYHSLALKSDGTAWGWGSNFQGELGNGTTTNSSTPVHASGLSGATERASSINQYALSNSDGATWHEIDSTNLRSTCTSTANQSVLLTANADLFTNTAGYNQDIGIFVSDNGGADQLLAWKESGGFAGTFSPNAAFAQYTYQMTSGHTYVFKLKWKTNRNAPGTTIYAGAGP